MHRIPINTSQQKALFVSILLVAIAIRVSLALYLGDSFADARGGTYDQISYDALAQRLVAGHGYSFEQDWWPYARAGEATSFWSYLYTFYLATVYALFGHSPLVARLIQSVAAGVLMPALVYRLAAHTFSKQVALLSAGIVAVYGYFVLYAASLMTETFYIICVLWMFDVSRRFAARLEAVGSSSRGRTTLLAIELGLAIGSAILLRQVVLFFVILLFPWLIWIARCAGRMRYALKLLFVTGLTMAILLSPWMARNYRTFNRLMLPNANAGFTFFWGNHPIHGTEFEPVLSDAHGVSYQDLIPEELRHLDEAALDQQLMRRGLNFVQEDPVRYLKLSVSRVPVYFLFWPTDDSSLLSNAARVLSFGLALPFMTYGIVLVTVRLWHHRLGQRSAQTQKLAEVWPFLILILLFIVTYAAIHLATWANIRYRLPVDAFLIPFAAYGLYDLAYRLRIVPTNPNIARSTTATD